MLAKIILAASVVAAASQEQLEAGTECTSVLQGLGRKALEARREELSKAREAGTTETEVLDVQVHAVDSALSHENVIDELESLKSKLHSNGYKMFPAGDAVTDIAEEVVGAEIQHQRVHEALALKLEDAEDAKDAAAKHFVLDEITNEFGASDKAASNTIRRIGEQAEVGVDVKLALAEAFLGEGAATEYIELKTTDSREGHAEVIEELEATKSKLQAGEYEALLPAGDVVTDVAVEALDEEIDHQKGHAALVEKLANVSGTANPQGNDARSFLVDVMTDELIPGLFGEDDSNASDEEAQFVAVGADGDDAMDSESEAQV